MAKEYLISEKIFQFWKEKKMCDVTLIAGLDGRRIPAHRLVLCASTDYFCDLLAPSIQEKDQNDVKIENINGDLLEALIECCYTGRIAIDNGNVLSLLAAASFYLFPHLEIKCAKYLAGPGIINSGNCIGIWHLAGQLGFRKVKRMAAPVLFENFMELSKRDEFYRLNKTNLLEILESDTIVVESEEDIFNALVRWTKFNLNERKIGFDDLVRVVRVKRLKRKLFNCKCPSACEGDENVRKKAKTLSDFLAVDFGPEAMKMMTYTQSVNEWTTLPDVPTNRIRFGAEIVDMNLYIIGGFFAGRTLNAMETIDLNTFENKILQPMPTARRSLSAITIKKFIYVVGGIDRTSLKVVERYDIKSNKWTSLPPLSTPRFGIAIANLSGTIFVMGGINYEKINSVESYDLIENKWNYVAPMIKRRYGARAGVAYGYIYVLGGEGHDHTIFSDIERYDPNNNTWTLMTFKMNVGRAHFGMIVFEGSAFLVGGSGNGKSCEKIHLLNGEREELPQTLHQMRFCFLLPTK